MRSGVAAGRVRPAAYTSAATTCTRGDTRSNATESCRERSGRVRSSETLRRGIHDDGADATAAAQHEQTPRSSGASISSAVRRRDPPLLSSDSEPAGRCRGHREARRSGRGISRRGTQAKASMSASQGTKGAHGELRRTGIESKATTHPGPAATHGSPAALTSVSEGDARATSR
jgi:hypothetical protein